MLIEMWSPVFKKHGEIREPIRFHHGLNVIMGMDLADNSIGKSSSLLAIDFIFGGNSYLKSIAVKKLGDHPIYFCFQFEKKFYFARDTAKPDIITYCNDDYSPTGETHGKISRISVARSMVKQCPWKSFWTNLRKGII